MSRRLLHPESASAAVSRRLALMVPLLVGAWANEACVRDSRDLKAIRTTPPRQASGVTASTWPLCSLIGPRSGVPGLYGTDLGFTAAPEGADKLAMLFGDTWATPVAACEYPPGVSDDLQAWIPRTRPAAFRAGPPSDLHPVSCNLLEVQRSKPDDPTSWSRIRLFPNAIARSEDAVLDMSGLRTPMTAFSDGERTLAVFFRDDPAYCSVSTECPSGTVCSRDPSYRGAKIGECKPGIQLSADPQPAYCRTTQDCGAPSTCEPADRGVCLATKPFDLYLPQGRVVPTWYHDDPRRGVVRNLYFGAALWPDAPSDYGTIARFPTNRFQNLTARTVAFFDPEHPERNDYRPGHHTLLLWGRAAFVEVDGAQALPFFMYIPLDQLRGDPTAVQLRPRYFAGYDDGGKVRWSDHELDAQPIYGTEAKLVEAGGVKLDWREPELDYVSQSTLSWVAPLRRWVMLYGGDLPAFPLLRSSGRAKDPVHLPFAPGAIHLRVAPHPWGAAERLAAGGGWTSPEPALTRNAAARYLACGDEGPTGLPGCQEDGDPHSPFDLVTTLGGLMLKDPGKLGDVAGSCIAGEFIHGVQDEFSGNPIGRLYGVNVIDEWSEEIVDPRLAARGEKAAEIYWNVSTWNPYQVILVKTRLVARSQPE